jgi:hypothetical protein
LVVTATGGVIYTSENAGISWSSQTLPGVYGLSVASSADGTKLVAAADVGAIYSSTNSGATWQVSGAPTNHAWVCLASSADGTKLIAGASEAIFTSMDSGVTWTTNSMPDDWISCVAVSADGTKMATVADYETVIVGNSIAGIILISTNSGVTWPPSLSPTDNWRGIVFSADGSRLFAACSDTFTGMSPPPANGIYSWLTIPSPVLKIVHSTANSVVSWIVPSTGFLLQQNLGLNSNGWTYVFKIPTLNLTNLQDEVPVSPTNDQVFYRLMAPQIIAITVGPP